MDCNKDEATRAKEIAERKFSAKDIVGAKKFALKAQSLYPNLEGLSQMLAVLDVYIAAETRISGESDWYGILGVNPYSDDETLRRQFRKLALMLHPDKNKSIGAEGAFKLISEASRLLSDKTQRVAYDNRRFSRTSQQKAAPASRGPSAPPGANGFYNFTSSTKSNVRPPKVSIPVVPTATPANSKSSPNSFWTVCDKCRMQYEYARLYVNHKLLCKTCHESFVAVEMSSPPTDASNVSKSWFAQKSHNSNKSPDMNASAPGMNTGSVPYVGPMNFTSQGSFQTNFHWSPSSRMAGAGNATASGSSAQAANVVQQAVEKAKREAQAAVRRKETLLRRKPPASKRKSSATGFTTTGCNPDLKGDKPVKKRRVDDAGGNGFGGAMENQMGMGSGGPGSKLGGLETERSSIFSTAGNCNSTRDLTQPEIRNMLVEKARREIHKKFQEWSTTASAKATEKEMMIEKEKVKDKETVAMNGEAFSQNKSSVHMDTEKKVQVKKPPHEIPAVDPDAEACEPMSIDVPDSDFHDFDMDRSERSFEDHQLWAAYDNDDGMPRYYAMIRSVMSLKPFKMRIGWLNPQTNRELGPLTWTKSGFSKTCGDFRVGKYENNNSLNSFSHKVSRWTKGARGSIQIYPSKGDVWALYRNWSPDWNEHTPDDVIHKYDMVEVDDDYNEEQGVSITPLVKVGGFKTVFHRHSDPQKVRRIPKEELFRFSHQVPYYLLTGEEAKSAPQGCMELDPAATPFELLQVITETKKQDTMEVDEEKTANEQTGS